MSLFAHLRGAVGDGPAVVAAAERPRALADMAVVPRQRLLRLCNYLRGKRRKMS